ncbi:MAG TPA: diaminopimelate epimerase [Polyangiaceae bacterium]|jgi:diaminopimelate epimerase
MSAAVPFSKYEGLGNDFVVFELAEERLIPPERAAALCDRRLGVGGDGVLLVLPPRLPGSVARMKVINADGSIPEMCGNGVRCVALHLARSERHRAAARAGALTIDTDAGPRSCIVDDAHGQGMVTVGMDVVRASGDVTVDIDGQRVTLATADAGNPHAVLFGAFARGDVERLGPRLATHPQFPRGTNVDFAHVTDGRVDLVVWERGVGITLACGTGACATAAVGCEKGLLARGAPVAVRLPGGTLDVTIDARGTATMRGPAKLVYSGVVDVARFA